MLECLGWKAAAVCTATALLHHVTFTSRCKRESRVLVFVNRKWVLSRSKSIAFESRG